MVVATQEGQVKIGIGEFQPLWSSHSSGGRQDEFESMYYVSIDNSVEKVWGGQGWMPGGGGPWGYKRGHV